MTRAARTPGARSPRARSGKRPSAGTIVKNAILGLLLVIMTLSALAGIAAAVWSSVGAGSSTASTSTTATVALTPGTPAAQLYPGGQADVVLSVSNPNTATVRIGSLTLDTTQGSSGFAVDSAHSGCALSALSYTTQSTGWTVPGKTGSTNGSLAVTLGGALAMSSAGANACQGATFTVYLSGQP